MNINIGMITTDLIRSNRATTPALLILRRIAGLAAGGAERSNDRRRTGVSRVSTAAGSRAPKTDRLDRWTGVKIYGRDSDRFLHVPDVTQRLLIDSQMLLQDLVQDWRLRQTH